jgi:hypothetical protein
MQSVPRSTDVDHRIAVAVGAGGDRDAGWDLVHYDWGLRQRESSVAWPARLAALVRTLVRRVVRWTAELARRSTKRAAAR